MNRPILSLTRQAIGVIGEDLPASHDFSDVINLNTWQTNFPIFDNLATLNGEVYVFSTKARKKYGLNGKINSSYNILYNSDSIARKWKKAMDMFEARGYDIRKMHYCFLVAPLEEEKDAVYYWGELTSLNPLCTHDVILSGGIKRVAVEISDSKLATYRVFGSHSWNYIRHKHLAAPE